MVIVPSATPPQFDSVGPWQTRIPISVAASTSTSSTPIVYFATIRSSDELSMILRPIGTLRIEVPMSACAPCAMRISSGSPLPSGVSQAGLPRESWQPSASSRMWLSRASSTGAKMNTLGELIVRFLLARHGLPMPVASARIPVHRAPSLDGLTACTGCPTALSSSGPRRSTGAVDRDDPPEEGAMVDFPVNDADGHITESTEQLRPYLEGKLGERGAWAGRRSYYPEDGWDRSLGGTLGSSVNDPKSWLRIMDEGGMETVILYPTGGLAIGWVREPDFAVALCRAYNNFVHQEFLTVSPRLRAVALLPFQDPPEAVKELRRAVTELGMSGAFAPAVGLRLPLGHPQFHAIYAEAERLGAMVACHATVRGPQFFGADGFDKFVEVHTLSHPVAQMIQLTGMIFEGVPEKYPSLRIGFMEAGCSWLPFWMDRMDEEWSKRKVEAPLCRKKPSDYLRSGQLFFAAEGDEKSVPEVIRRLGNDIIFYASDVPHWDHDFPDNIRELARREDLSVESKRKILYENTRRLYELTPAGSIRPGR